VRERDYGGKAPVLDTDTIPKRPTYKQDWAKYNEAQETEKTRFQELLFDLCRGVPELPQPKTGRKPHRAADALFTMTFKVYSTFSGRRFACDLADAHAKGFVSVPISGTKIHAFFDNPALTPVLHDLIRKSALPLRAVETTFAPDSTGFSTSRFVKWFDEKHGAERSPDSIPRFQGMYKFPAPQVIPAPAQMGACRWGLADETRRKSFAKKHLCPIRRRSKLRAVR
jgi:hypothetical protein